MSVTNPDPRPAEATENHVPPALRAFARQHCRHVERIEACDDCYGWKIEARNVTGQFLPELFRIGNIYGNYEANTTTVYIGRD